MIRFEKIETAKPTRYKGPCQECGGNNITYLHDIKCVICDNATVIWCPDCAVHYKVNPEQ